MEFGENYTDLGDVTYKKKVVQELELRIWGCSLSIEQQNMDNIKDAREDDNGEDIQNELWKLIKRE